MAREQLRDLATLDELLPAGMGTVVEKVDQTVSVCGKEVRCVQGRLEKNNLKRSSGTRDSRSFQGHCRL